MWYAIKMKGHNDDMHLSVTIHGLCSELLPA
jgi:hypothetical protein